MGSSSVPAKNHYEQRAKEGYGLMFPDGHVIRAWENYLKQYFPEGPSGKKMLDFGCWNGTHSIYFMNKGFSVAGVDIIEGPVLQAVERSGEYGKNFHVITDADDLVRIYDDKFDFIFSNQVMYFLDDATLAKRLWEFDELLTPDGFVFFSMMTRKNYFAKYSHGPRENGLETIKFPEGHRFAGKETYVRFMESPLHLQSVFCRFTCLTVGMYDVSMDIKDSAEHYIFIGRKRGE